MLRSSVIASIVSATGMRTVLSTVAAQAGRHFGANRVVVLGSYPVEWKRDDESDAGNAYIDIGVYLREVLKQRQEILQVENVSLNPVLAPVRALINKTGLCSLYAINTRFKDEINGAIVLFFEREAKTLSTEQLDELEEFSNFAAISIHNASVLNWAQRSKETYKRIVDHTEALFIQTDKNLNIKYLSENSRKALGLSEASLVNTPLSQHIRFFNSDNLKLGFNTTLFAQLKSVTDRTGFIFRAAPLTASDGRHVGWDFVGLENNFPEEDLGSEKKRIDALLQVSTAIRGSKDPAEVAKAGLEGLCKALGAHAGLCYLGKKGTISELNLISCFGVSKATAKQDLQTAADPSLSTHVYLTGEPALVTEYEKDERVSKKFFSSENFQCGLVVPIASGTDEVLGTLGIYSRDKNAFSEQDITLALAAANQIGLIIKQADLLMSHKNQARKLSALYRMNHALSTNMTMDEVFQRAFRIIHEEIGVERLWLGLLDETGRTLVGHAAFGPGWKRRLVRINVDITNQDNKLTSVIVKGSPVKVDDSSSIFGPLGLDRIVKRLEIQRAIFIPLISRGYVLGVLAAQRESADGKLLSEEDETLLMSLSSELASLLHARQLEKKIVEGERMRSLGVLASGIAHNFNNILQGVVGQASLLDLKQGEDPVVKKAVRVINDSAAKGSKLVEKLLSFTQVEEPNLASCKVDDLLVRNKKSFERLLTKGQKLKLRFSASSYKTQVDPGHLIRIITNLISNANDASSDDVLLASEYVSVSADAPFADIAPGEYIRIVVRDRGVGMDEETLQRCFEPFFTTKDVDERSGVSRSGAGLGLAVAYGLARRNGGKLVVESDKNGTGFALYLPVHRTSTSLNVEVEKEKPSKITPLRLAERQRKNAN